MSLLNPAALPRRPRRRRALDWGIAVLLVAGTFLLSLIFQSDYHSQEIRLTFLDQNLWAATAFLAVFGWVVSGPLTRLPIRRKGKAKPDTLGRHAWVALTLPFLALTAVFPFTTPMLAELAPHKLGFALIASVSAFLLIPRVIRRFREATWARSELMPARMAGTRPGLVSRLRTTAQAFADSGVLVEGEPTLLAHGDRDMHLRLKVAAADQGSEQPAINVQIFNRLVQISSPFGWLPAEVVEALREVLTEDIDIRIGSRSSVALVTRLRGLESELGSAAARIVEAWETRPTTDPESSLAGPAPDSLEEKEWSASARLRPGGRVRWLLAGQRLFVEDPDGDATFELDRPFKLMVSRIPDGAVPMLSLTVRQSAPRTESAPMQDANDNKVVNQTEEGLRAGATRVGQNWNEARLRVPLLWHDSTLEHLPIADSTGPALTRPSDFRQIWRRLYWAAIAQGETPPALPDMALGLETPEAEEERQWYPGKTFRKESPAGAWLSELAVGALVLTGAYYGLGYLTEHFVRFPIWEDSSRGLMTTAVAAGIVGLAFAAYTFASMKRYLRNAVAEVLELLETVGLDTDRCTVHMPTSLTTIRQFARQGRTTRVNIEFSEGLTATLTVWPAGFRAAGLHMVEQLELTARPSRGTALEKPRDLQELREQLASLHSSIQRLDAHSTLADHGPERVLSLQTRRKVGSGEGAWLPLRELLETPESEMEPEKRHELLMQVGLIVPSTHPMPAPSSLAAVTRRPPRGAFTGLLGIGTMCSVLAFPGIFTSDYPTPPTASPAALAEACLEPQPDENGAYSLYDVLKERRCLLNADGFTTSLNATDTSHGVLLGSSVTSIRHARGCKDEAARIRRAATDEVQRYAVEMHRRLVARDWPMEGLGKETELKAAWGIEPWQTFHLVGDLEDLLEDAHRCADDPDMSQAAMQRVFQLWRSLLPPDRLDDAWIGEQAPQWTE